MEAGKKNVGKLTKVEEKPGKLQKKRNDESEQKYGKLQGKKLKMNTKIWKIIKK